jgi:hypothetical protein
MIEVPKVLVSGDKKPPPDFDLVKTLDGVSDPRKLTE